MQDNNNDVTSYQGHQAWISDMGDLSWHRMQVVGAVRSPLSWKWEVDKSFCKLCSEEDPFSVSNHPLYSLTAN